MVKLRLNWSREHVIDFSKQLYNLLVKDRLSESFDITLYMESCNITIAEGEVSE